MGMFGGQSGAKAVTDFDPSQLSTRQKIMLFGAALKDAGAGLDGRDSNAFLNAQAMMGAQAAKAKHDSFLQQMMGTLAPQYQAGPAPTVAAPGLIGGQAAQAPSAPVDDPSSAISGATAAMAPGPTPQAAAPYQYQPPQRTSNGLTINDPRMGALTLGANDAGVNMKDLLEVLKAQQPSMMNAQDGTVINSKNPAWEGRQFPKLDNGIVSQRDASGNLVGASDIPGYADAAGRIAGGVSQAQESAKAALDLVDVPRPDGSVVKMPRSLAVAALSPKVGAGAPLQAAPVLASQGGFGVSQAPADKTYAEDNAKAASTMYQGLQTAAQKAPGQIANYQRLGELLAGVDGGKLSPLQKDIASAANSMGFKIDKDLPNKEAAAAISNQLALSLRDPSNGGGMPGAMSDADRNFLLSSVPNLAQTAQGRAQMVQAQVKVLQRQQDVAAKARAWQGRFGRIDKPDASGKTFQDYLDAYAAAHPLFAH